MFRNISIVERITIDCCRLKVALFLMQRVTIQKLSIMELKEYVLNYTVKIKYSDVSKTTQKIDRNQYTTRCMNTHQHT